MASKLKRKLKETAVQKMRDHDIWNYIDSDKDIDLKEAYSRIVNSGLPMDYKTFRTFAHGYLGASKRRPPVLKAVPVEIQKAARALEALHTHGFDESMPGSYNAARAEAYADKKYLYRDGTFTSPKDDFGNIVHEASTKDYIMYEGGPGTLSPDGPYAMLRGSRLGMEKQAFKDWIMNFGGYVNKEMTAKLRNEIEENFEKSQQILEEKGLGRVKKVLGYSRGGPLSWFFGQKYKIPSISLNGDLGTNVININKTMEDAPHEAIRTMEDPVSMLGIRRVKAMSGLVKGFKTKTVPELLKYGEGQNIATAHDLKHFTEDGTRALLPKSTAKLFGLHYKKMLLNEMNLMDLAHEMRGKTFEEFHEEAMKRGYTINRTNPMGDIGEPPQEGIELPGTRLPGTRLPTPEELRRTTVPRPPMPEFPEVPKDPSPIFPDVPKDVPKRVGKMPMRPTPEPPRVSVQGEAGGSRDLMPGEIRGLIREDTLRNTALDIYRDPTEYLKNQELARGRFGTAERAIDQQLADFKSKYGEDYARAMKYRITRELLGRPRGEVDEDEIKRVFQRQKRLVTREIEDPRIRDRTPGIRRRQGVSDPIVPLNVIEELDETSLDDLLGTQSNRAETRRAVEDTASGVEIPEDMPRMPAENNSIFTAYQMANGGDAESLSQLNFNDPKLNSVFDLKRMLSNEQYEAYLRASPTEKLAIKQYLMKNIMEDTQNYMKNYHEPFGIVGRGIRNMLPTARGIGGGMLASTATDFAMGALEKHFNIDPNSIGGEALEGTTAGMAGEMGGRFLTGEFASATAAMNLAKIGEGGFLGGVQTILTPPLENAAKHGFDLAFPHANEYVRDITSDMIGSVGAFFAGAGLLVAGSAGASALASSLFGAGTLDAWNPSGWVLLVGGVLSLLGGALQGWFEAGQIQKQKEEVAYAGQAETLKNQYGVVRQLMDELGDDPTKLLELDQQLAGKLDNKNVQSFKKDKDGKMPGMQQLMNQFISSFQLKNVTYLNSPQALQLAMENTSNRQQNITNSLVQRLKANGIDLTKALPAGSSQALQTLSKLPFFQDAKDIGQEGFENYTEYYKNYNTVIDFMNSHPSLKGIVDKLGLQTVNVPTDPGSLLGNTMPYKGDDASDVEKIEEQMESGAIEKRGFQDQAFLQLLMKGQVPTGKQVNDFITANPSMFGPGTARGKIQTAKGLASLNQGNNPLTGQSLSQSPLPKTVLELYGIQSKVTSSVNPKTGKTTQTTTYSFMPGITAYTGKSTDTQSTYVGDTNMVGKLNKTNTTSKTPGATIGANSGSIAGGMVGGSMTRQSVPRVITSGAQSNLGNMTAPVAHTQEPSEPDPPVQTNAGQVNQLRVRNPQN